MSPGCHATSMKKPALVLALSLILSSACGAGPGGSEPGPGGGGSSASTGGKPAGAGGTPVAGTGGMTAPPATGGVPAGTGGATPGTGGSEPAPDTAPPPPVTDAAGESSAPPPASDAGGGPTMGPTSEMGPEGLVYTAPMSPPGNSPLTVGWTQTPFKYRLHTPRNLPPSARYSYDLANNEFTLWVLANDQPFQAGNNTDPRSEMRWVTTYPKGGHHMFDADVWIEPKTQRTNIMQVFMTTPRPTSLMITAWDDGNLRTYFQGGPVLKPNANGNWWNLKVHHDTVAGRITVYGDDKMLGTFSDRGGSNWYFKNGVYGSRGRSETRWRNIRYWVKK